MLLIFSLLIPQGIYQKAKVNAGSDSLHTITLNQLINISLCHKPTIYIPNTSIYYTLYITIITCVLFLYSEMDGSLPKFGFSVMEI